MSQQMQKYADWLVANQNKKGTPEFDTVANAYKQLRGQQQQQPAAPQPQGTDGAFMYGVDRAQQMFGKGLEVAGRLTGQEGIEQFGTDMVAQQERDIAAGGYQPKYGGSLRENYQQGTFLPALGEKLLENLPSGGLAIAGLAPALLSAPAWLTFATGTTAAAASGIMGAGESALEQEEKLGGDYNAKVAAGTGALIGFLDRFGAGKVIPTDKLAGMTAEEVIQELSQKGFADAAQAYASKVSKAAVGEGATEIAQEGAIVATTAAQGGKYTPQEVIDRGIDAGALGSSMGGGTSAVTNLAPTAASTREAGAQRLTEAGDVLNPVMVGNDPQAATELAVRLDRIAQANDLNLRDVGKTSTKGAREAVDKAHIQMTEELKQLARDLKAQLGITDQDELSVVMDKVMAIAAQREARNKAKSTVGVEEMQAVDRLVGNTQEGQRMLSLMRQMNELTTLHNEGYIGGLSQYTDQLSPIPSNVGYSDRSLIETPTRVLGTLYGASVNPLIPAVQGAAVLTGRTVDALTGRRSRVAKYISDNVEASEGIDTSGSPSVRRARQREAEALKTAASADARRAKEIHKELYAQNGDLPFLTLDTMLKEMGLSPQQAVKLLEEMKASMPTVRADADDMIRSIKEGGRFANMTAVGAAMRTALDQNQTSVTRDKTPIAPQAQAANPLPAESAGYLRGIEDNRAANDALVEAVNGNANIAPIDKLVLIEALADLRSNLGANPAERAMDIAARAEAKLQQPELADTYLMPYINRVVGQQANDADVETNFMAVPEIGEGQAVRPVPPLQSEKVLGQFDAEGQYVAMPQGDIISGNTYDGARIYINPKGFGGMEVDANQQQDAKPDKSFGKRFKTNLFKKFNTSKNGKKTNNLWTWVNQPDGNTRTENDQEFLVAFVSGGKHYYTTDLQANVPTELDKDRGNINAGNQPFLRPSGYGEFTLGEPIGYIRTGQGNEHPVYDQIRVEPKDQPVLNMQQQPVLSEASDPFGIGDDIGLTSVGMMPTDAELADMKAGTFVPEQRTKLEVAYGNVFEKWKQVAGQDTPLEYTPENVERIARMMATEGLQALQRDNSAIGWYDATLKAAKDVLRIIEPRIDANEQAFDFALAVTSNGQAVTENFKYALDAFRTYLDTGVMPEDFKQGGERNKAMRNSFKFFNAWQQSGQNMPLDMFMDSDFTVAELRDFIKRFNEENGTNINIGSQESLDTIVKGSYVLGPKIGQGFYQNLRGNFEPLTMDIWWMRMWNRLVGRPFEAPSTEKNILKRRNIIKRGIIDSKDKDMKRLVNEALEATGETRRGLYTDPDRFDKVIAELAGGYQRFYNRYKKRTGKNHVKPKWIAAVGTHKDKMFDKLQASPLDGPERSYMREVTQRARELLSEQGYDINTADFQALMWYPEKQLAEKMGIAKGKGEDNDYLDAAKLAATREGITDEQIQEALSNAERDRLDSGASARQQDGSPNSRSGQTNGTETSTEFSRGLDFGYEQLSELPSRPAEADAVRQQLEAIEQLFPAGQPIPIGKKGTPFENGITPEAAKKIAEALGYAFTIYKNGTEFRKGLKSKFRSNVKRGERVLGALVAVPDPAGMATNRETGERTRGEVAVVGVDPKTLKTNLPDVIWTAMHELGHAVERLGFITAESPKRIPFDYVNPTGKKKPPRSVFTDTFRGYLTKIIDTAGGGDLDPQAGTIINMDQDMAKAVVDEMLMLQRTGILQTSAGVTRLRREYERMAEAVIRNRNSNKSPADKALREDLIKKEMFAHEDSYLHTPQEMAADMIGAYMMDPKGFKKIAPTAAEVAASLLNRASSPSSKFMQFYSAPLASVIAVIMATLAAGEEEKQNEEALLSLGRGALSA